MVLITDTQEEQKQEREAKQKKSDEEKAVGEEVRGAAIQSLKRKGTALNLIVKPNSQLLHTFCRSLQ